MTNPRALPVAEVGTRVGGVPIAPTAHPGRILVIDDEEMVGVSLRRVLSREHHVTVITEATDAVDRIASGQRFDVILCDLMMPNMGGIELYRSICELCPELAGRIVFMTGGAFTRNAAEFLDSVPNARLNKPFDTQELRELVRVWVDTNACLA